MKNNTSGTPEWVYVDLFIYRFRSYNDLHQDNTYNNNIYLLLGNAFTLLLVDTALKESIQIISQSSKILMVKTRSKH
jgi:hypothetical protein